MMLRNESEGSSKSMYVSGGAKFWGWGEDQYRTGRSKVDDYQFFNATYDFTFVGGHKLSQRIQLRNFAKALKKATRERVMRNFADWFDAFDTLEEYLESLPSAVSYSKRYLSEKIIFQRIYMFVPNVEDTMLM